MFQERRKIIMLEKLKKIFDRTGLDIGQGSGLAAQFGLAEALVMTSQTPSVAIMKLRIPLQRARPFLSARGCKWRPAWQIRGRAMSSSPHVDGHGRGAGALRDRHTAAGAPAVDRGLQADRGGGSHARSVANWSPRPPRRSRQGRGSASRSAPSLSVPTPRHWRSASKTAAIGS